jgi:hypothetical protein
VRQRRFICLGILLCSLLAGIARADSFQLNDGSTVTGDIVSANDNGLRLRLPDGSYSDSVAWTKFSQDDLKRFAKDPKMQPFVAPFIEETEQQRIQKTEVAVTQPHRLRHPATTGLFGAMLSSTVGLFVIVLLYGAGIYAAYEVAMFRRRPPGLVCGLAAVPVIGFLSPILFLALPAQEAEEWEEEAYQPEPAAPPQPHSFTVPGNPPPAAPVPAPGRPMSPNIPPARPPGAPKPASASIPLPEGSPEETSSLKFPQTAPAPQKPQLPQTQIFQRGAFMFNRRFFETKFPGFSGVTRREADKDMVLIIKSARGEYIADRISRISSNDFSIQVRKDQATHEVMIPFTEVQEVRLKHKDSP